MNLSDLKSSKAIILTILGVDKVGQHVKCPFHEEKHGSLSIWMRDEVWFWKCMAGCGGGTAIDAAMLRWGLSTPAEGLRKIEGELGVKSERDEEIVEPVLNMERAEKFIAAAHDALISDFDIQEKYLLGKRGIHDLGVVKDYRLGFVKNIKFPEWKEWRVTGWAMPITSASGNLKAVRLHMEGRRPRNMPKCLWAPFGTYKPEGAKKPRHASNTLWPPPERWIGADRVHFCPGELKALAVIGLGLPATSTTFGESGKLHNRLLKRLVDSKPRQIIILADDDKAGLLSAESRRQQMDRAGLSVRIVNQKEIFT